MKKETSANTGLGFAGALTILFIGLKLGGVIQWSWLWVLSPIWITAIFAVFMILIVLIAIAIFKQR